MDATVPYIKVMTDAAKRWMFLVIGWTAVALGVIGAFLPLLPTVPFMLVALWAFARSSPRLSNWLLSHPRYGPPLQAWQENGAVSKRAKITAVTAMAVSVVVTALILGNMVIVGIQAAVLGAVAVYVWTRPDPDRARQEA